MSRRITAVAGLAATSLLLAACGGSSDDGGSTGGGDSTGGGSASGEAVSYWLWDANQLPAYQMCADTFTETSGIEVEIEQYGVTVALVNNHVISNRLEDIAGKTRNIPEGCELLTVAKRMGISLG